MKKINFLTALIAFSFNVNAQYSISGTVTDSLQKPIPGATILIVDSTLGVQSNTNGIYILNNLKPYKYQLKIDFIGYKSLIKEVEILNKNVVLNISLKNETYALDEYTVAGTRVGAKSPYTHSNINFEDYEKRNLGQDIPILLQNSISVVSTSDAGAGVGYTGFRIRGSDATRINVTINGIPLNDAESQGVFWVNMPDFASSINNIQIQRGVGSSTNGAGAFGASVNIKTSDLHKKAYGELSSSYGSFNTHKESVKFGTGLIDNKWVFDGRISSIQSNGYIDRASSNLKSFYLSGGYYGKKTSIKAIAFSGKEKTYQSWWGTPESRVNNDVAGMQAHAANNGLDSSQTQNLLNSGRTYNYYQYENEIDNYQQDHYQLHISHQFSDRLYATTALHLTYGRGYFEQFRKQDDFATYGLSNLIIGSDTITQSDFIRRRWLSNYFYGAVYNLNYKTSKTKITLGGALNRYNGGHYGEIIWAQYASDSKIRNRYYNNNGVKIDFNTYLKADYLLNNKITVNADLQVRALDYKASGIDNNLSTLNVKTDFVFFNPKAGINYQLNKNTRMYASVSVGNKEPSRNDFIDNPANKQPKHETLVDYEFGTDIKLKKLTIQGNIYFMDYYNQLILTGKLNDVGSSVRTNVKKSYRAGIELNGVYTFNKYLKLTTNATFSQNKINNFNEVLYDYTNGFEVVNNQYKNTDIAFSPNIISAASVVLTPFKGVNLMIQNKYVGKQYLDNTSNNKRKLNAYDVVNTRLSYTIKTKKLKEISFNFLVNNVFNSLYSSNGYTYSYIFGNLITENFQYPQAGTNFLIGLTFKF